MFYGVIHEDYEILSEFDLKGALNTIKTKIKNAILGLLNTIDKFLDKCKDGKIKSGLKNLIAKLKKLLGEADNINSESDAKKVNEKYEKCGKEFKDLKNGSKSGFYPSNFLQEALEGTDAYKIVGALMGYINADPAFRTTDFRDAVKYAKSKSKVEFIEKDYNSDYEMTNDKSKWDEHYYSFQRVYLKENFCYKRMDHVEEVAKWVYRNLKI